jgi:hypothetical protein
MPTNNAREVAQEGLQPYWHCALYGSKVNVTQVYSAGVLLIMTKCLHNTQDMTNV